MSQVFSLFSEFFANLSFTEGTLLTIIILGGLWLYKNQQYRFAERQRELDRLAEDNHNYRDRFERLHELLEKRYLDHTKSTGDKP